MRRSPWWARAVVLATLAPLVASIVVVVGTFLSDRAVRSTVGSPEPTTLHWQDRWATVVLLTPQFGDPVELASLTVLGGLVLAVVSSGAGPGARVLPAQREVRRVLPWTSAAAAVWAVATAAATVWFELAPGTAGEDGGAGGVSLRHVTLGWTGGLLTASDVLLPVAVAVVVALWCRRPGSDERVVEDAGERARTE